MHHMSSKTKLTCQNMQREFVTLPKRPIGDTIPVPPPKPLLLKSLPTWSKLPYDIKCPLLNCAQEELTRKQLGQSLYIAYPDKEFDLTYVQNPSLPNTSYNALQDPHLQGFFQSAPRYRTLVKKGLITKDGKVKAKVSEYNQYRMYLYHLWVMEVNQLYRNQVDEEKRRLKGLLEAEEDGDLLYSKVTEKTDHVHADAVLEELTAQMFRNRKIIAEHGFSPFVRSLLRWKCYQDGLKKNYKKNYPAIKQWLCDQTKHYKHVIEAKLNARRYREKKIRSRWIRLRESSRARLARENILREKQQEIRRNLSQQRHNRFQKLWLKNERLITSEVEPEISEKASLVGDEIFEASTSTEESEKSVENTSNRSFAKAREITPFEYFEQPSASTFFEHRKSETSRSIEEYSPSTSVSRSEIITPSYILASESDDYETRIEDSDTESLESAVTGAFVAPSKTFGASGQQMKDHIQRSSLAEADDEKLVDIDDKDNISSDSIREEEKAEIRKEFSKAEEEHYFSKSDETQYSEAQREINALQSTDDFQVQRSPHGYEQLASDESLREAIISEKSESELQAVSERREDDSAQKDFTSDECESAEKIINEKETEIQFDHSEAKSKIDEVESEQIAKDFNAQISKVRTYDTDKQLMILKYLYGLPGPDEREFELFEKQIADKSILKEEIKDRQISDASVKIFRYQSVEKELKRIELEGKKDKTPTLTDETIERKSFSPRKISWEMIEMSLAEKRRQFPAVVEIDEKRSRIKRKESLRKEFLDSLSEESSLATGLNFEQIVTKVQSDSGKRSCKELVSKPNVKDNIKLASLKKEIVENLEKEAKYRFELRKRKIESELRRRKEEIHKVFKHTEHSASLLEASDHSRSFLYVDKSLLENKLSEKQTLLKVANNKFKIRAENIRDEIDILRRAPPKSPKGHKTLTCGIHTFSSRSTEKGDSEKEKRDKILLKQLNVEIADTSKLSDSETHMSVTHLREEPMGSIHSRYIKNSKGLSLHADEYKKLVSKTHDEYFNEILMEKKKSLDEEFSQCFSLPEESLSSPQKSATEDIHLHTDKITCPKETEFLSEKNLLLAQKAQRDIPCFDKIRYSFDTEYQRIRPRSIQRTQRKMSPKGTRIATNGLFKEIRPSIQRTERKMSPEETKPETFKERRKSIIGIEDKSIERLFNRLTSLKTAQILPYKFTTKAAQSTLKLEDMDRLLTVSPISQQTTKEFAELPVTCNEMPSTGVNFFEPQIPFATKPIETSLSAVNSKTDDDNEDIDTFGEENVTSGIPGYLDSLEIEENSKREEGNYDVIGHIETDDEILYESKSDLERKKITKMEKELFSEIAGSQSSVDDGKVNKIINFAEKQTSDDIALERTNDLAEKLTLSDTRRKENDSDFSEQQTSDSLGVWETYSEISEKGIPYTEEEFDTGSTLSGKETPDDEEDTEISSHSSERKSLEDTERWATDCDVPGIQGSDKELREIASDTTDKQKPDKGDKFNKDNGITERKELDASLELDIITDKVIADKITADISVCEILSEDTEDSGETLIQDDENAGETFSEKIDKDGSVTSEEIESSTATDVEKRTNEIDAELSADEEYSVSNSLAQKTGYDIVEDKSLGNVGNDTINDQKVTTGFEREPLLLKFLSHDSIPLPLYYETCDIDSAVVLSKTQINDRRPPEGSLLEDELISPLVNVPELPKNMFYKDIKSESLTILLHDGGEKESAVSGQFFDGEKESEIPYQIFPIDQLSFLFGMPQYPALSAEAQKVSRFPEIMTILENVAHASQERINLSLSHIKNGNDFKDLTYLQTEICDEAIDFRVDSLEKASEKSDKDITYDQTKHYESTTLACEENFILSSDISVVKAYSDGKGATHFPTGEMVSYISVAMKNEETVAKNLDFILEQKQPRKLVVPPFPNFIRIKTLVETQNEKGALKDILIEININNRNFSNLHADLPAIADPKQSVAHYYPQYYEIKSSDQSGIPVQHEGSLIRPELETTMKTSCFGVGSREWILHAAKDFIFQNRLNTPYQLNLKGLDKTDLLILSTPRKNIVLKALVSSEAQSCTAKSEDIIKFDKSTRQVHGPVFRIRLTPEVMNSKRPEMLSTKDARPLILPILNETREDSFDFIFQRKQLKAISHKIAIVETVIEDVTERVDVRKSSYNQNYLLLSETKNEISYLEDIQNTNEIATYSTVINAEETRGEICHSNNEIIPFTGSSNIHDLSSITERKQSPFVCGTIRRNENNIKPLKLDILLGNQVGTAVELSWKNILRNELSPYFRHLDSSLISYPRNQTLTHTKESKQETITFTINLDAIEEFIRDRAMKTLPYRDYSPLYNTRDSNLECRAECVEFLEQLKAEKNYFEYFQVADILPNMPEYVSSLKQQDMVIRYSSVLELPIQKPVEIAIHENSLSTKTSCQTEDAREFRRKTQDNIITNICSGEREIDKNLGDDEVSKLKVINTKKRMLSEIDYATSDKDRCEPKLSQSARDTNGSSDENHASREVNELSNTKNFGIHEGQENVTSEMCITDSSQFSNSVATRIISADLTEKHQKPKSEERHLYIHDRGVPLCEKFDITTPRCYKCSEYVYNIRNRETLHAQVRNKPDFKSVDSLEVNLIPSTAENSNFTANNILGTSSVLDDKPCFSNSREQYRVPEYENSLDEDSRSSGEDELYSEKKSPGLTPSAGKLITDNEFSRPRLNNIRILNIVEHNIKRLESFLIESKISFSEGLQLNKSAKLKQKAERRIFTSDSMSDVSTLIDDENSDVATLIDEFEKCEI